LELSNEVACARGQGLVTRIVPHSQAQQRLQGLQALPRVGLELPGRGRQTPAALDALVRSEIDLWVPIIKKAGVVAQ
jgi:hypothetical protein